MEASRLGRPRLPASELEQLFRARGIGRQELAEATGYTYNYVSGVMRGHRALNGRFVGKVVLRWPSLATALAEYVRGVVL